MANEIVVGSQVLTGAEVLIATLAVWHPFVDVYVDGSADPALVGSQWNVYAVANGTRTRLASGTFTAPNPRDGQRVLAKVPGLGATIELRAFTPHRGSVGPLTAAIVGWDPGTSTPNASDSASSTASQNPGPETLFATIPWHPNVAALVQAPSLAKGSLWRIKAVIPGLTSEIPIAAGTYLDVLPSREVCSGEGGAVSWRLYVSAPAGPTGPMTGALFGNATPGSGNPPIPVPPLLGEAKGIVWKPGVPSALNHVATWAEVQAIIVATSGLVEVACDDSIAPCSIPAASGLTDGQWRTTVTPGTLGFVTLNIEDGAILRDMRFDGGAAGLFVTCAPSIVANRPLQFTADPNSAGASASLECDNVYIFNSGAVSTALLDVAVTPTFTMKIRGEVAADSSGAPAFFTLAGAVQVSLILLEGAFAFPNFLESITPDIVPPFFVSFDASCPSPAFTPVFTWAATTYTMLDRAAAMLYADTAPLLVPAPAVAGNASTQEAIDALKRQAAPGVSGLRLSLVSGVPVTTADVADVTLYLTPYTSGEISLFTSGQWKPYRTAEVSLALAGLTAGDNYDVFAQDVAGVVTLSLSDAWASNVARTDALARQDGALVLAADHSKLWVGTLRATGAATTEDSQLNRFLWNAYNRVDRKLKVTDPASSWAYAGAGVWRQANANAANAVHVLCGDAATYVRARVLGQVSAAAGVTNQAAVGIGIDSTTVNSADAFGASASGAAGTTEFNPIACNYDGYPGLGFHALNWIEMSNLASATFFGTNVPGVTALTGSIQS